MSFKILSLNFLIVFIFPVCIAVPQQIGLNYGKDESEMVVTWADTATKSTAQECLFGTSPDSLIVSAAAFGSTYTIDSYTSPMLYKATMFKLIQGNKLYYYKIGSAVDGYSSVYSFKSHPGIGVGNITFHFLGDPGQTENSVNTMQEILDAENALTTLSGGIVSMGGM